MLTSKTYTFFLVYIILNFISGFAVLMAMGSGTGETLFSLVWQAVFFIPLIYIGTRLFGGMEALCFGRVSPVDVMSAALLALAIIPVLSIISAISALFFPNTASDTLAAAQNESIWISVISLCIMPAVFEELTFRGVIFSGLRNLPLSKACIVGGLIFALAHFSLQSFLYTFITGFLFCFIVYRTKSVIPGMVTHFTINLSQVVISRMSYSAPKAEIQAEPAIMPLQIIWMIILSMFISLYLLSLMGRKYGRAHKIFLSGAKKEFVIENEDIFDYAPEKGCEERVFDIRLLIILAIYLFYVLSPYFGF